MKICYVLVIALYNYIGLVCEICYVLSSARSVLHRARLVEFVIRVSAAVPLVIVI